MTHRAATRSGLTLVAAVLLLSMASRAGPAVALHFADADDAVTVRRGANIYQRYCASCHGRKLQGQALWQLKDKFEGRRAPPHDATGHTWEHSDEDIFAMTKFGRILNAPAWPPSFMPAFGSKLADDDIISVIAFIKSRWPLGIRASQAMLNPGFAGMPAGADKLDWTLPPNCSAALQNWKRE